MTQTLPEEISRLRVHPSAPLLIVDVDEVLALFMKGFERFVSGHGYEMRITRFALFQNIYDKTTDQPMDLGLGRQLFDEFFAADVEHMEPAPGGALALASLAPLATIVILTNAPHQSRDPRSRWLERHGFPYPLILNSGPKGPAVAALAEKTTGPAAFIDDLLPNLDSAAEAAPHVHRFQMIADERLRAFAPSRPESHFRSDDWADLAAAVRAALQDSRRAPRSQR
jgi:hypothetical protein